MARRGGNNTNRIAIEVEVDPSNRTQSDVNKVASAVEAVLQRNAAAEARNAQITSQIRARNVNATEQQLAQLTRSTIAELNRRSSAETAAVRSVQADIRRMNAETARATRQINQQLDREERARQQAARNEARRLNQERIRELREQARQQAAANSAGSGRSGASSLFGAVLGGNLVTQALLKFASLASSGGQIVLEYSAKIEQVRIGFETLTGSVEAADKHIRDLQQFAKETPFEFDGLAKGSQLLQGVGIKAEKVIPLISNVGNALAAAGKNQEAVDRTLLALSQISGKGKLAGQEINQLAENGIAAVRIVAEATGKSQAQIRKLSEEGRITSDLFFESLDRFIKNNNLGDAMVKQSRTFNGALSNIKDSLLITSSKAFEPLFQKVSTFAVDLADKLNKNKKGMEGVGEIIGDALVRGIGAALGGIGDLIIAQIAKELRDFSFKDIADEIKNSGPSRVGQKIFDATGNRSAREYFNGKTAQEKEAEVRDRANAERIKAGLPIEPVSKDKVQAGLDRLFPNSIQPKALNSAVEGITENADVQAKKLSAAFGKLYNAADGKGGLLKIPETPESLANKKIAALDLEAKAVQGRIEQELKLQKILNSADGSSGLALIRKNAAAEENFLKTQIALTEELAAKKLKSLSFGQRENGQYDALVKERDVELNRLNSELEIAQATAAKQKGDEIKKLLSLTKDFKADAISILENNEIASALDEISTSAERAQIKFKDLGEEAVKMGAFINRALATRKFNQLEFGNNRKAIDAEFEAQRYESLRNDQLDGFARRLEAAGKSIEFFDTSLKNTRALEQAQYFANLNVNNPRPFLPNGSVFDQRVGFTNSDGQQDSFTVTRFKSGLELALDRVRELNTKVDLFDTGLQGKAKLANVILSSLPDNNALVGSLGDTRSRGDAQRLLNIKADQLRIVKEAEEENFNNFLANNAFVEKQKKRADELINNVNTSGLTDAEKRSERLAIFKEVGDELTVRQKEQAIKDNRAERDDLRNQTNKAIKSLAALESNVAEIKQSIFGDGLPVNLGDQANFNLNVRGENVEVREKESSNARTPDQQDVQIQMGFFRNEGGLSNR